MKKGFTFIEIIIALGIIFMVIGGIIMVMSRGASNVARGSFRAIASNQAAWVVYMLRKDIAISAEEKIEFPASGLWDGNEESETFTITTHSGLESEYSIKKSGENKEFVRSYKSIDKSGAQRLASEYLEDISIEKKDVLKKDSTEKKYSFFLVNITFKDPSKKDTDAKANLDWSARIYIPVMPKLDQFWKPIE